MAAMAPPWPFLVTYTVFVIILGCVLLLIVGVLLAAGLYVLFVVVVLVVCPFLLFVTVTLVVGLVALLIVRFAMLCLVR